jgi:hypothetical protein
MEKLGGYTIQPVWNIVTDDISKEIIQFWSETKAILSDEQRRKRVKQVALIARGPNQKVVGVITTFRRMNSQLGHYFYYLRGMVHTEHEHEGVGRLLSEGTKAFFNNRFKEGEDSDVIGLFMEVENVYLKTHRNHGNSEGFIFVGKNLRGDHCRVYYFEGARI